MAFNISGLDEDLYFTVNTVVNVSLFTFIVLPPLILCLMCIVALLLDQSINLKIKVLLINILMGETVSWFAYLFLYLTFPIKARFPMEYDILCIIGISTLILVAVLKFPATSLYAINAFIFIRYNEHKLKWRIILPGISIAWAVSFFGFSILAYIPAFGIFSSNGFCSVNPATILFRVSAGLTVLLGLTFLGITGTFAMWTYCYIKKNALEGNGTVKKAAANILFFLFIISMFTFFTSFFPIANPAIRAAVEKRSVVGLIAVNYILRVIYNIPSMAIPVLSIVLAKPLRVAMKHMLKKVLCCCLAGDEAGEASGEEVEPAVQIRQAFVEPAVEIRQAFVIPVQPLGNTD